MCIVQGKYHFDCSIRVSWSFAKFQVVDKKFGQKDYSHDAQSDCSVLVVDCIHFVNQFQKY